MARLSEIVEKVKSNDGPTREQADEQISLLNKIGFVLERSNTYLANINKTMIDTMSAERRNNDKLLLAFRESEMEKKKEQLRGTSADEDRAPRGGGFGFGDLLIPAFLAWQTGLDDVIQAITVVPTILKEIATLIGGKLLDGFRLLKNAFVFTFIKPIENIIDFIKNSKTFELLSSAISTLMDKLKTFMKPISDVIGKITDDIKTVNTDMFAKIKTTIQNFLQRIISFISRPFEIAIDAIKNSKFIKAIGNTITAFNTALSTFSDLFKSFIITPINKGIDAVKQSKLFKALAFDIGTLVDNINNNIVKPISNLMGRISGSKTISSISDTFTGLFSYLSKFTGVMKSVSLVSKLLSKLPILNVIFGVYDFIQGFLKGYNEDGLLAGIKEGIFEVVRGLVTKPLDLIKDVMSWAATKLGFSGFSEVLDKFSFTRLFDDYIVPAINGIIDWLGTLFTDPVPAIKTLMGNSLALLENLGQWIYDKTITPVIEFFNSLFTAEKQFKNGPNRGLAQSEFQVPEMISNFGKWFYDNTIGQMVDFISSWIPEGGVVAQMEKLLGDSLRIFTDFAGWFHEKFTKPLTELFTTSETPAEINTRIRQGSGGARRGEVTIVPREMPRDDRPPVVIGHVGPVNNTTTGGGGAASASGNIQASSTPGGFRAKYLQDRYNE